MKKKPQSQTKKKAIFFLPFPLCHAWMKVQDLKYVETIACVRHKV